MREDFVKVKINGKFAHLAPVRVIGGRQDFHFEKPETVLEVTKAFDYERILEPHRVGEEPMFELVVEKKEKKEAAKE